jgi:hypothetical protein
MIVNITTRSDSDFTRSFTYQYAAVPPSTTPTPIDLTGSSFRMVVRASAKDVGAYLDLSTDNGRITLTNPLLGQFQIMIPKSLYAGMPAGEYVHSLIRTRPDTVVEEVWYGALSHSIGPTR